MITRFKPVRIRRTRRGPCQVCTKTVCRSKTFEMTVNPFNKNPDGTVRTEYEVYRAVGELADAWSPDFIHETCLVGVA